MHKVSFKYCTKTLVPSFHCEVKQRCQPSVASNAYSPKLHLPTSLRRLPAGEERPEVRKGGAKTSPCTLKRPAGSGPPRLAPLPKWGLEIIDVLG